MSSLRYLREKAAKEQIYRENPDFARGIRTEAQRREQAETKKLDIEAARELARKRAIELDGEAPEGQVAPGARVTFTAPAPAPTGQTAPANSSFTGVAGRNVGFSSNANAGFSGVSGSRVGFNRESPTATPTGAPPRRETFAEEDARTRREKTLSGAFGEKAQARAQNLEGRKSLFAEMKAGGLDSATARKRAEALGVDDKGFNTAVARIEGVDMTNSTQSGRTVTGAELDGVDDLFAKPQGGRALAEKNIATMGVQGAAADYFKRAEAEKTALAQRSPLNTVSSRFADTANRPAPAPARSFAETFGTEVDRDEPSPAMQQARANTVAARRKADTMRAGLTGGERPSPLISRASPQPAAVETPAAPPRAAPTSLFGAIREDVSSAKRTMGGVGMGARLLAARGIQGVAEGAGSLIATGARTAAKGYLTAKEIEAASKQKAKSLVPGRTGEYLRTR
jgi:hypothetical protein